MLAGPVTVRDAQSSADLDAVRRLMRAFIAWHYERHAADRAIVDSYFDPVAFDAELAALPGPFSAPEGALLVAEVDGEVAGCVALRRLDRGSCEMKRMFLDPRVHGRGIGLLLGRAVIERARELDYRVMKLDTGPRQWEAQGLYRVLGFQQVEAYYDLPQQLREWLVFMELHLDAPARNRA